MPVITKAMIFLEGIAKTTDPEFDLFISAYPFATCLKLQKKQPKTTNSSNQSIQN